ncbi:MAG: LmeA family phospholipid-binding protein [Microbacteriaceae bacterium]
MDRDQQPFDWGFGGTTPTDPPAQQPAIQQPAAQQPPVQRSVSQWPQQSAEPAVAADPFPVASTREARQQRAVERYDDGVSYNALDLGFEEQEVPRRGLFARIAGPVITLVILGGLIGGGAIAGDGFAKKAVTGVIQDKVGDTLELSKAATKKIDVDLGGGFFIAQAIAGTIDDVAIVVPQATFGELEGRLAITAVAVPVNPTQPTGSLGVTLDLDGDNAVAFANALQPGASVVLGDESMTVSSKIAKTAIAVAYSPSVAEGVLVLTPQTITVAKKVMTPEEFAASKYAQVGAALLEPKSVCVAGFLPAALTFTAIAVSPTSVTISASGDDVSIARGLTTFGMCEQE